MAEPQPVSRIAAATSGLLYVAYFVVLASVLRTHFGFPLDDSWIHQVIARNLAENHVLGFPWKRPSAGSTSLIWTLLLAAGRMVLPRLSQVTFCLAVNGLFLFGIGYCLKRVAEEDGLGIGAGWVVALAPALSGNFLWFGLTGMEHLLFILFTLLVVDGWFTQRNRRNRGAYWMYVAVVLLVLTRPEGCVLAGMLALVARPARRSLPEAVGLCISAGAGLLISAAVNWRISHRLIPQTMQGRQWLAGYSMGLKGRGIFLGQVYARMLKTWSIVGAARLLHGWGAVAGVALLLVLLGLMAVAVRYLWAIRAERLLVLTGWAVVVCGMYLAVLPNTGHGGRYIAVTLMMFLVLLFLGIYRALQFVAPTRVAVSVVVMLALITLSVSLAEWRRATADGIDQINSEHGVMGEWLAQNMPQGSFDSPQVAVFDIGRIGYEVKGNLIDLGGLVDPKFGPYLVTGRTAEYLAERRVRWVVLPTEVGNEDGANDAFYKSGLRLDQADGMDLEELHTVCADGDKAKLAMEATAAAFPCQTLYAIKY